jgi:hypothetical protein
MPACGPHSVLAVVGLALSLVHGGAIAQAPPLLRLSPQNPHYLEFRGKPIVLVSSAEHYGAVINQDFDFQPYLAELARHGLNQTRLWTGFYVEDPTAFNITHNTLAPAPNRYLPPWARSAEPGYANGGNKFDLSAWNPAFWTRLKAYLAEADRRDVIVEVVLFCPFYEESMWRLSPLHEANNINGIGVGLSRQQVYDLSRPEVTAFQEAYVRKVVTELNGFDNIYYELVNEPYSYDLVPAAFERHMADLIVSIEKDLPKQHLIAQNIANGSKKIERPHPAVSIFNFHYAAPPTAVAMNHGLGKVIADDETGFRGQGDLTYRLEAWHFLLAGGGVFSHLDYSFTTAHPSGTWMPLPKNQPGGGGPAFRRQMRILADFMKSFDFVKMAPNDHVLSGTTLGGLQARALVEVGRQYAIYVSVADSGQTRASDTDTIETRFPVRELALIIELAAGRYEARWIDTMTGKSLRQERFVHTGGRRTLHSPSFTTDVALKIVGAAAR